MAAIFSNNATSLLAVAINTSVTTVTVQTGDAAKFPTPTGGDWFPVTVIDGLGNMEIMRCTGRTGANLTVVRAQEGTTAQTFSIGARVDLRLTAAVLATFLPSASYTAVDVLAKLLTVDGTGSGLDADLLDGQSAAFYLDLTNATGTIEDDNVPARVRGNHGGIYTTNLDTALDSGWYSTQPGATGQPAAGYWMVFVMRFADATAGMQIAWDLSQSPSSPCYRRTRNGGVWGAWQVVHMDESRADARYVKKGQDSVAGNYIINNAALSTRQVGFYWADMSQDAGLGAAVFGSNLYASWNGAGSTYRTSLTNGSVGYSAIRFSGTSVQITRFAGATTQDAAVTPTWFDVLDKGNYKGARSLGLTQANFTIGAGNYDSPWVGYNSNHTLTLPSAATAGIGAVIGPLKAFDAIALTIQRAGSDVIKTNTSGGGVTSLVLAQGQEVTLTSDGSGSWYAHGYGTEVPILDTGVITNVATIDITLPPGFRSFKLLGSYVSPVTGNPDLVARMRTAGGSFRSGASDYRDARLNVTGGSTSGGGFSNSTSRMWLQAAVNAGADFEMNIYGARQSGRFTQISTRSVSDQFGVGFDARVTSGRVNTAEDNDAIQIFMASGNISADNLRLVGIV